MNDHLGCTTLFVIALIVYVIFILPKIEDRKSNDAFDNRVTGCIDGIFFADVRFRCIRRDVRSYAGTKLSEFRRRADGPGYIEYTTTACQRYSCHFGTGDHMMFALICIAEYAAMDENPELIEWCELQMVEARINGANYTRLL
jgi:hypothetical protein